MRRGKLEAVFRWANLAAIVLTLAAYLSPLAGPARYWPFAFLGLVFPILLVVNLLFIAGWLVARKRYFLFSLGCLALGWPHVTSLATFRPEGASTQGAPAFTLTSFNAHELHDRRGRRGYLEAEALDIVLDRPVDILCFQEFPYRKSINPRYKKYVVETAGLPHMSEQAGGGLIIFTRYPIVAQETHYFSNRANGYQIVDLKIGDYIVRVFNVHLQSNSVTSLAEEVAMHGNIKERETWRHIKGMLGRYWHMAKLRATQAETLSELIAQSPYPVLLAGDLNDVPQSYVYRRAGKGLKDTFRERGWGLGVTYVGYLPGLRIDYIFASGDFNVLDHRRGPRDFSDHRPVSSRLELAPP